MKIALEDFPAGSLIRFMGDEWLSDLQGKTGLVVAHTIIWGEPAIKVLVDGKNLDLPISEIDADIPEIIRVDI